MKCIFCQGDTIVADSRLAAEGMRRNRKCKQCRRTFFTMEIPEKAAHPEADKLARLTKAAQLYLVHLQAVLKQIDRTANP